MPTARMRGAGERHPVSAFFFTTFGYSWAVFGVLVVALGPEQLASSRLWHIPFAWGPPLAAVVVQWLIGDDVRAWLRRMADPLSSLVWYAVAAAVAFLFADSRSLLAGACGANLRDALVESKQDPTTSRKSDLGFVLLLHLAGTWRLAPQWRVNPEADAQAGGPGRAGDPRGGTGGAPVFGP